MAVPPNPPDDRDHDPDAPWQRSTVYRSILPGPVSPGGTGPQASASAPPELLDDPYIVAVLDTIEQSLTEPWRLDTLARAAGLGPFQLHRRFRAVMGETVGGYIRRTRLDMSAVLVCRNLATILDAAMLTGYGSQAAFTRAFVRQFGFPPDRVREAAVALVPPPTDKHHAMAAATRPLRVGATPLIAARFHGPYQQVPKFWARFAERLRAHGFEPAAVDAVGILHDDPGITVAPHIRYDCCIVDPDPTRPLRAPFRRQALLPGDYAGLDVEGPYAAIADGIFSVCALWIPQQRRAIGTGPAYELHRRAPWDPGDFATHVLVPLG
jgi:AraC family transcriptional regulator